MKKVDIPLDVVAAELEAEDHTALSTLYRKRLAAGEEMVRPLLECAEAARVEALYRAFEVTVELVLSGRWDEQVERDRTSKRPLPVGRAGRHGSDIWDLLAETQGIRLDRRRKRPKLPTEEEEEMSLAKIREAIARHEQRAFEDHVSPSCSCLTRPGTEGGATTWREWSTRLKGCNKHGTGEHEMAQPEHVKQDPPPTSHPWNLEGSLPVVDKHACTTCGIEERVEDECCSWCRADNNDRPWGSCSSCQGPKDRDGTCYCTFPTPRNTRRACRGEVRSGSHQP